MLDRSGAQLQRGKKKHTEAGGAVSLMATVFSTRPCVSIERNRVVSRMQCRLIQPGSQAHLNNNNVILLCSMFTICYLYISLF